MLHSLVLEQLKKHAIESAMITHLFMYKNYLMTKERMEKFFDLKRYTGEYDWVPRESINDNLENFVEELCHRKEQEHSSQPYFVSKLTKEEMKLVENKNKEYTETYFRGSFGSDLSLDISAEEIKLSESKSKYVNAQCYRTTLIVKNYELSKDDFYHFEFVNRRDDGAVKRESTIQVCFRKQDMTYNEMESLAECGMGNRHAWAIQTIKSLQHHNLKSMKFSALTSSLFYLETLFQKDNPFHQKLIEQNWQEARIVLHTSVKSDTVFHRILIEEKVDWESNSKKLLLWLLLCYVSYKAPRSYPKTWS